MKVTKVLTVLLLIVLTLGGWFSFLNADGVASVGLPDKERQERIAVAQDYIKRGLYQKAIAEYESITAEYDKEEDWQSLLAVYQMRYEEDEHIRKDYLDSAKRAVRHYPADVSMCTALINICIPYEEYGTAYQYARMTKDAGGTGEDFEKLYRQVAYSYQPNDGVYTEVRTPVNHCIAASEGDLWGIIDTSGKGYCSRKFRYVSNVGEDGVYVRCSEDESILIDGDDIIQGRLDFVPDDAGILSEGLIPLKHGGSWSYYNELGDKIFGEYDAAGTFSDGKAAVSTGGKWVLINQNNEEVSSSYDKILLSSDGTWNRNGIMIAVRDGKYNLYSENEKQIGELNAEEMDRNESDLIAFKSGDLWGYADKGGNIVIDPAYEDAQSFSNGLGAIKVGDGWGFINRAGELVVENRFLEVGYLSDESSCMVKDSGIGWYLITFNNPDALK